MTHIVVVRCQMVNIQRVTLKIPSETHGGPHVTCRHLMCKIYFGCEYVNNLIHLTKHKTPCYNWHVWTYVNGSTIWLNVRVNSTDLQGGECILWNAKPLWSQQVIRGMLRLPLRTFVIFNNGQGQLITDKWILYWRKTRKYTLKTENVSSATPRPSAVSRSSVKWWDFALERATHSTKANASWYLMNGVFTGEKRENTY